MNLLKIEQALVESIDALEETRWTPKGSITEWSKSAEGYNHASIQRALDTLRDLLIQIRSGRDEPSVQRLVAMDEYIDENRNTA